MFLLKDSNNHNNNTQGVGGGVESITDAECVALYKS